MSSGCKQVKLNHWHAANLYTNVLFMSTP